MIDNICTMKIKSYWVILLSLFFVFACEDQRELQQVGYNEDITDRDSYDFSPMGETLPLFVQFTGRWTLSKPEWVNVSYGGTPGRGMQMVYLTTDLNASGINRAGTITIQSPGSSSKSYPASQEAPFASLVERQFYYPWNKNAGGNSNVLHINTNLYWKLETLSETEPVVDLSATQGFGEMSVIVAPLSDNLGVEQRVASYRLLVFADSSRTRRVQEMEGVYQDTLEVRQENYRFLLNEASSCSLQFDKSNYLEQVVRVELDNSQGKEYLDNIQLPDNWIAVNREESQSETGEFILKIVPKSANISKYDRNCKLVLRALPSGAERLIFINQEKYNFYFSDGSTDLEVLRFNNLGGTGSVNFVSSGPWSITNIPSGVRVNPMSGDEGETLLSLSVSNQNLSLEDFRQSVVVTSTDPSTYSLRDTLEILQAAFKFEKISSPGTLGANRDSEQSFDIQTSGPWHVSSQPSWLDISPSSGEAGDKVSLKIVTNSTNESTISSKRGTIEIRCDVGNFSPIKVDVEQMRTLFDLSSDHFDAVRAYEENGLIYEVQLTSTQDWEVASNSDWITPSMKNGKAKQDPVKISFTVANNLNASDRSGSVVIRNESGARKTISFKQDGMNYNTTTVQYNNITYAGGKYDVKLDCYATVPWEISIDQSWVTASPESGKGDKNISFTVTGNKEEANRSAIAIIRNKVTNAEKRVNFSQTGFSWSVDAKDSYSFAAFSDNSNSQTIRVKSTGPWTITCPDWLKAEPSSGSGSTIAIDVKISCIKDNAPSINERSGTISVKSNDFSDVYENISVRQEKYQFSVNPTSLSFPARKNLKAQTITVTSDGSSISASSDKSWAKVSVSGKTVTVTCDQNKDKKEREAIITIKDSRHTNVSLTVRVKQSK